MSFLPIVLGLVMTTPATPAWTPPAKPDLQAILQEAHTDTIQKRYPQALAKHLWFHENSVKIDRAFYGVRLSFALMYWKELGEAFPPAMAELKNARDTARLEVTRDGAKNAREAFHDFLSINRTLGDEIQTTALFAELDKRNLPVAKEVFGLAMPSLIKVKDYKLCGKYLDPKATLQHSKLFSKFQEQMAKDPKFNEQVKEGVMKAHVSETATMVALLVINDRKPEAAEIVAVLKKEWTGPFPAELNQALEGVVPAPWPPGR